MLLLIGDRFLNTKSICIGVRTTHTEGSVTVHGFKVFFSPQYSETFNFDTAEQRDKVLAEIIRVEATMTVEVPCPVPAPPAGGPPKLTIVPGNDAAQEGA